MSKTCIIIGASHSGAQMIQCLRQEGWTDDIIVIGEEPHLPYHRPPLSKAFLLNERTAEQLFIRPAAAYEKAKAEFKLGNAVTAIDRDNKTVTLSNGENLSYDKLAICTGARVRKITTPGSDLNGIHYLRTIDDVKGIQEQVAANKKAVIVGGGYIGLEVAAALKKLGMDVTVLEMTNRVLERVTSEETSAFFTRAHQEEGVKIVTNVQVTEFCGNGHIQSVKCADGSEIEADLVVVGIGIIPNVEIAQEAGIEVDNGIVTDQCGQTNDPDIVSSGDCANHPNELYQTRVRLESIHNTLDQTKAAAASICGNQKPFVSLPWFWSDQYDIKLQIAGLNTGYDQTVVRGDIENERSFAVFYLKDGVVISADCVRRPKEFMIAKQLIAKKAKITADVLADESLEPKQILEHI